MTRKEFERVSPEEVGLSSLVIAEILDELERADYCEPHGIMIMRHGKVCAEGCWAPYGLGIPHELFSMTKTYTATALGIAYTERLIDLDEYVLTYFPEYASCNTDPKAQAIRVRDVLTMTSGKPEVRCATENWSKHFFEMESAHEPGTVWAYSCEDTHCIESLVQRVTGCKMHEYLNEKLFKKIGINADNLKWARLPDGCVIGCGGLFATLEDSLRLIKLYMDDGVWEGERILSHEYVSRATQTHYIADPDFEDKTDDISAYQEPGVEMGYAYQIWTNVHNISGTFAARGAIGQYAVAFPELDMIVSFQEASKGLGTNGAMAMILSKLKSAVLAEKRERCQESEMLSTRLRTLSLGNPPVQPNSPIADEISGRVYTIENSVFTLRKALWNHIADSVTLDPIVGMDTFSFVFHDASTCQFAFREHGEEYNLTVGLDGFRRLNRFAYEKLPDVDMVVLDGAWVREDTFRLNARWLQSSYSISIDFCFADELVNISCPKVYGDYDVHPMRNRIITATQLRGKE